MALNCRLNFTDPGIALLFRICPAFAEDGSEGESHMRLVRQSVERVAAEHVVFNQKAALVRRRRHEVRRVVEALEIKLAFLLIKVEAGKLAVPCATRNLFFWAPVTKAGPHAVLFVGALHHPLAETARVTLASALQLGYLSQGNRQCATVCAMLAVRLKQQNPAGTAQISKKSMPSTCTARDHYTSTFEEFYAKRCSHSKGVHAMVVAANRALVVHVQHNKHCTLLG
jgi:hypothetical protein